MFEYNATVTSVFDGDTITVDIDLGFGLIFSNQKIRLLGINAPEINSDKKEKAIEVRDWLRDKLLNQQIRLQTVKDRKEKYGRYLGIVYLGLVNINQALRQVFPENVTDYQ